ncbi:MAG: hypothetical protein LHV69_02865, partial [Elusimicrobia bacterium]|nr:hypothetical protein [Candidatus Obscuribacterium magneticum]
MNAAQRITKAISLGLSISLFVTNVLLAHAPQTSVWAERRKALTAVIPAKAGIQAVNTGLGSAAADDGGLTEAQLASLPASLPPLSAGGAQGTLVPPSSRLSLPKNIDPSLYSLLTAISPANATLRDVSLPIGGASGKTIVHIQDVHLNAEAQSNIAKTVQELIERNQVGLVALEGAFTPIDLSAFRSFPRQATIRKVADYLFKENKISGPVYAAFTSPEPLPFILGVDDPSHYEANIRAYRQALRQAAAEKTLLARKRDDLHKQKREVLNHPLLEFDQKVEAYRQGALSMGPYVQYLGALSSDPSTAVEVFLEAFALESKLDFNRVELERSELLSQLLKRLSQEETTSLINHSLATRLGTIPHADFYQYLKELCEKKGVSLARFPAMWDYIHYILLAQSIKEEKLLADMRGMEEGAYSRLIRTNTERDLIRASRSLYLAGKLLDFALTPEEWSEYKTLRHSRESVIPAKAGIQASNHFKKHVENLDAGFRRHDDQLASFESFYGEAEARDRLMAEKLLRAMDERGVKIAVLVTGGFHANGIEKILSERNAGRISVVPRLSRVESESGSRYLTVFSQDKMPLEKLFEGQMLFLANNPVEIGEFPYLAAAIDHPNPAGVQATSDELSRRTAGQVRLVREEPGAYAELNVVNEKSSYRGLLKVRYNAQAILNVIWRVSSPFGAPVREFFRWIKEKGAGSEGEADVALSHSGRRYRLDAWTAMPYFLPLTALSVGLLWFAPLPEMSPLPSLIVLTGFFIDYLVQPWVSILFGRRHGKEAYEVARRIYKDKWGVDLSEDDYRDKLEKAFQGLAQRTSVAFLLGFVVLSLPGLAPAWVATYSLVIAYVHNLLSHIRNNVEFFKTGPSAAAPVAMSHSSSDQPIQWLNSDVPEELKESVEDIFRLDDEIQAMLKDLLGRDKKLYLLYGGQLVVPSLIDDETRSMITSLSELEVQPEEGFIINIPEDWLTPEDIRFDELLYAVSKLVSFDIHRVIHDRW